MTEIYLVAWFLGNGTSVTKSASSVEQVCALTRQHKDASVFRVYTMGGRWEYSPDIALTRVIVQCSEK